MSPFSWSHVSSLFLLETPFCYLVASIFGNYFYSLSRGFDIITQFHSCSLLAMVAIEYKYNSNKVLGLLVLRGVEVLYF